MLLTADWLLPVCGPPVVGGAVLVSQGKIIEVGPHAELRARYPDEETRDYPGCVLLPGLINAHTHLEFSAFRGFSSPSGFSRWMMRLLRARRRVDSEDLAASAAWGACECVRNGVTAVADTSYEGLTVARAARAAGLRARVYLEVFGLDDRDLADTMARLRERLAFARGESASADDDGTGAEGAGPAVEWGLSPHAPYTVSRDLYREVARMALREKSHIATHVGESRAEVRLLAGRMSALTFVYRAAHLWTGRRWRAPRLSPVEYIAEAGVLGPSTLVVHAVQTSGQDITTLAGSGAAVAHCPRSNLHLRCGAAPVAGMRAAGIQVGLGTDSLASNDSLDMLAEMRAAVDVSRRLSAELSAEDVLGMATLEGARALGWDRAVGSLEPGKRADVVAVRISDGQVGEATGALAEAVMAGEVLMTMVDGRVVYEGGTYPDSLVRGLAAARVKLGLDG